MRTPAKAALAAPSRELAQALAAEWDAQRDTIDPARMPLTRLANAIIDGVVKKPEPVAAEIEKYLGSDLLFYRADEPEGLVAAQAQHWDPVLQWAHETFGARFVLAQGITFVAAARGSGRRRGEGDPAASLAARRGEFRDRADRLGLLALALAHGRLDVDAAWAAAHVDEDWNMAKWGRDEAGARAARVPVRGNAGGGTSAFNRTSAIDHQESSR